MAVDVLAGGERIVRSIAQLNAIPVAVIGAARDDAAWLAAATREIGSLLGES